MIGFSPEGDEIAAFTTHPNPRLFCWSNRGKLLMDVPIPDVAGRPGSGESLVWLPEKAGWLVNGVLVDRASRRAVLRIHKHLGDDWAIQALDNGRLLGRFSTNTSELRQFTIPWESLRASLAAMADKAPALLAPHQPVSLDVKVTQARGDLTQLAKLAREAVTKRIERDGITVADGQTTVVRVVLSEEAGRALPIFERQSPFDFRGRDTGRKATEAHGAALVEIVAAGEAEPLWRDTLKAASSRLFIDQEVTNEAVRQSMLDQMARQLNQLDIPYFIPKSRELVALPAVVY